MHTQLFAIEAGLWTGSWFNRLTRWAQILYALTATNGERDKLDQRALTATNGERDKLDRRALLAVHVGLVRGGEIVHAVPPCVRVESIHAVLREHDRARSRTSLWVVPPVFGVMAEPLLDVAWDNALLNVGVPYDKAGAVAAGVDGGWEQWFPMFAAKPVADGRLRMFCSELVRQSIPETPLADGHDNPAEVTPRDVLRWPLWALDRRTPLWQYAVDYPDE